MSSMILRRTSSLHPLRSMQCIRPIPPVSISPIASTARRYAAHQAEESYDAFNERYEKFFYGANDKFEVQRGLNNVFAYDLVPSVKVCEAALRACRRVADYSTSVRIFEALREKTENKTQYDAYCSELKPVREELGTFQPGYKVIKLMPRNSAKGGNVAGCEMVKEGGSND